MSSVLQPQAPEGIAQSLQGQAPQQTGVREQGLLQRGLQRGLQEGLKQGLQQGLQKVLNNPAIWRAEQISHGTQGIATGRPILDKALPDQGWPTAALTELLLNATGIGELSLLTPALQAVTREGRGVALLAPPLLPQARAWEAAGIALNRLLIIDAEGSELLWAAEQALRSGECGAVLLWAQAAGRALNHRALQRLHLAASTGNAACFLYRETKALTQPSPAPLRIRLKSHNDVLQLQLVKSRGALHDRIIALPLFPAHWQTAPASITRMPAQTLSIRKKAAAVIQGHIEARVKSKGSSGAKPMPMDGEMLPSTSTAAIASLSLPTSIV